MENPAMQVPKIDIIVANPEGLIVAQTTTVKVDSTKMFKHSFFLYILDVCIYS
jgi:hypothetical protein